MMRSVSLGRLLLDTGVITQAALDETLAVQRTDRRRLGELLVERGVVHPQDLAQLLSHQMSCPWISLAHLDIAPEVISLLPRNLALEHAVVPVHLRVTKGSKVLYVATDDPTDDVALDECGMAAKMAVRPMVAVSVEVRAALARFYGGEMPVTPAPPKAVAKPAAPPVPHAPHAPHAPPPPAPPPARSK
jgi:type IV pilus assembly protein PilB